VPVLIVLYLLAVGALSILAQMLLPVMFPLLDAVGFSSALVPLLVIFASIELGDERALIIAGILGLGVDLICDNRLGNTSLILFSLSALIVTQADRPETHTWLFRLTFVLVGTFAFLLLSYVLNLAESFHWSWPLAVWSKITFASLLNLIIAPLFFYLVALPPRLCGWRPGHEMRERTYAG
jgi:cell shape-determining protein MreD